MSSDESDLCMWSSIPSLDVTLTLHFHVPTQHSSHRYNIKTHCIQFSQSHIKCRLTFGTLAAQIYNITRSYIMSHITPSVWETHVPYYTQQIPWFHTLQMGNCKLCLHRGYNQMQFCTNIVKKIAKVLSSSHDGSGGDRNK